MKKILFLLLICLFWLQCGCTSLNTPPTFEETAENFYNNQEEIQIVLDYIVTSIQTCGYETIIIHSSEAAKVWTPNERKQINVSIDEDSLKSAVEHLLMNDSKNRVYYWGEKNTIYIKQWHSHQGALESGICYSTAVGTEPYVEGCLELTPIDDTGWYYYLQDYD